jgi:hypothetical protein
VADLFSYEDEDGDAVVIRYAHLGGPDRRLVKVTDRDGTAASAYVDEQQRRELARVLLDDLPPVVVTPLATPAEIEAAIRSSSRLQIIPTPEPPRGFVPPSTIDAGKLRAYAEALLRHADSLDELRRIGGEL